MEKQSMSEIEKTTFTELRSILRHMCSLSMIKALTLKEAQMQMEELTKKFASELQKEKEKSVKSSTCTSLEQKANKMVRKNEKQKQQKSVAEKSPILVEIRPKKAEYIQQIPSRKISPNTLQQDCNLKRNENRNMKNF